MITPGAWLGFEVGGQDYALPLAEVAEVARAPRAYAIPLVQVGVGGVVNLGGEPLPAVDAGALLTGTSSRASAFVVVLERRELRIGVLVGSVRGIERELDLPPRDPEAASSELVVWLRQDGRALGLIDFEGLIDRAARLLSGARSKLGGDEVWQTGF